MYPQQNLSFGDAIRGWRSGQTTSQYGRNQQRARTAEEEEILRRSAIVDALPPGASSGPMHPYMKPYTSNHAFLQGEAQRRRQRDVAVSPALSPETLPAVDPNAPGAVDPVLLPQSAQKTETNPILMDIETAARQGYANPATGGKRDATQMSEPLNNRIGLGEGLIRVGGAIVGASGQGALDAINAGTDAYGGIQDYNRTAALEEAQMAQEKEMAEIEYQRGQQAKFAEDYKADNLAVMGAEEQVRKLDSLYNEVLGAGDNLTGLWDGTVQGWWDKLTGDPRAYTRMKMEQFKVDQVLITIGQTKGAISNKEMEIFERPLPDLSTTDEKTWLSMLDEKRQAARNVMMKLKAMRGQQYMTPQQQYSQADNDALFID